MGGKGSGRINEVNIMFHRMNTTQEKWCITQGIGPNSFAQWSNGFKTSKPIEDRVKEFPDIYKVVMKHRTRKIKERKAINGE